MRPPNEGANKEQNSLAMKDAYRDLTAAAGRTATSNSGLSASFTLASRSARRGPAIHFLGLGSEETISSTFDPAAQREPDTLNLDFNTPTPPPEGDGGSDRSPLARVAALLGLSAIQRRWKTRPAD
jgi:hypothetical protein